MLEAADLEVIKRVFNYYDIRDEGEATALYGEPLVDVNAMYDSLHPYFSSRKKEVTLRRRLGESVLTVRNAKGDNIWINVALAILTLISTTVIGAMMYGVDIFGNPGQIYMGLPFALAIMAVLGSHELGHYIVSKKYGIDVTLPYFIPFPIPPIGTMGAVIRQKGPVPSRKALFDVGISGPLVGLAVAIVVTVIGLMLPAPDISAQQGDVIFQIQTPLLFDLLAAIVHPGTLKSINPIAFAGWVGMLVTMLNLLPIGQLDGGHVARAVLGEWADRLSRVLPMAIMAFGVISTFVLGMQGDIWIIWGLLTSFMGSAPHPKPLDDNTKIDSMRVAVCAMTIVLWAMCFTPFPFST